MKYKIKLDCTLKMKNNKKKYCTKIKIKIENWKNYIYCTFFDKNRYCTVVIAQLLLH